MSTFTNWNGPHGSDVQASDLVQFANSYSDLLNRLNQHLNETVASNNVHAAKDYIDSLLPDYAKLVTLNDRLTAYYTKIEADNKFATKEMLPDLTPYAKHTEIPDITPLAIEASVADRFAQLREDIQAQIDSINALLTGISRVEHDDEVTHHFDTAIESSKKVTSHLIEFTRGQIMFHRFNTYVGGTNDIGVYYLLGMLTDRAGTAYIKYTDDQQMSAAIHFAEYGKGALTVTCANNTLHWLKFMIVRTTDAEGVEHAYLAVQAKEWLPTFTSTDGVGYHKTLQFEAGGINFAPVSTPAFIRPNGAGHIICTADAGNGSSASNLIFNRDIGEVVYWPKFEIIPGEEPDTDIARAVDFPDIFLACDGSEFDTARYKELYEKLGTNKVPVIDYCVIMARSGFDD